MKEQENKEQMTQAQAPAAETNESGSRVKRGLNRRITLALVCLMTVMAVFIILLSANAMKRAYYAQYSE